MAANTEEFDLFFPLGEVNPQGWLNDFITPQLMRKKESVAYTLLYNNYALSTSPSVSSIKNVLNNEELFNLFIEANERKFKNEEKFVFINGKYSDILENNLSTNHFSSGNSQDLKEYILFMNSIKPFQMAFIQPYVRLYYGWKDDPKNKKSNFKFIEFPFSQYFDLNSILSNPNAFLEGSGIKSISNDIQFNLGTKKNCNININYFFSNMNILTRKIEVNKNKKDNQTSEDQPKYGFSFMKLFSNIGIKKEVLKLEYGYYVDPALESQHQIPLKICNFINTREVKKFGLLKTSHNFKFNKEGGVEISVTYVNLAEAFFESDNNIAIPNDSSSNQRIMGRLKAKSAGSLNLFQDYNKNREKLEEVKEKIQNLLMYQIKEPEKISKGQDTKEDLKRIKQKKIDALRQEEVEISKNLSLIKRQMTPYFKDVFITSIKDNFDLYSISFNTKKDDKSKSYLFNSSLNLISPKDGKEIKMCDLSSKQYNVDDFFRKESIPESVKSRLESILNRIFNTPREHINSDKRTGHIVFFPLRALIRVAYQMVNEDKNGDHLQIPSILFGNLTSRIYDKTFNINTGNILIELNYFQKWMHEKFYSKGFLDISFGQFIKEVIDDLVPEALYRNKTYPQNTTRITIQDYNPSFYIAKGWESFGVKNLVEENASDEYMKLFAQSVVSNNYDDSRFEPLIIYSKLNISTTKETTANNFSVSTSRQLELNESDDAARGIPHLIIGSDGGMFLNADFQQIDLKGLRSGIALQALTDDNSSYFFYQYSISAEVFGSSIFNHGSIICIPTPPLGLAGSDYDIGVVGYYKVKGLKDSIDANGTYKSVVSGDWFWSGGRYGKNGKPTTENDNKGKKITEILDYVPANTYDPASYIDLLIKTDIKTLTNFGIKTNKQTTKGNKKKPKEEKIKKPQDYTEGDISKRPSPSKPKTPSVPAGQSVIPKKCPAGSQAVGEDNNGNPICVDNNGKPVPSVPK